MTNTIRRLVIFMVIMTGISIGLKFLASRIDNSAVLQRSWNETVKADDPTLWLRFLSERQQAQPEWSWRRMPEPARNLWVSVTFELSLPKLPDPSSEMPDLPTYAEVTAAYAAMGMTGAANLVSVMAENHAGRRSGGAKAWSSAANKLVTLRKSLQADRAAYAEGHRLELDRIFPGK